MAESAKVSKPGWWPFYKDIHKIAMDFIKAVKDKNGEVEVTNFDNLTKELSEFIK